MKLVGQTAIVIRRDAVLEKGIRLTRTGMNFANSQVMDQSDNLILVGPLNTEEAVELCMQALETLGLHYLDDFYCHADDGPAWCSVDIS